MSYLLCALGDGTLFYFILVDNNSLTDKKKVKGTVSRNLLSWGALK
jgi:hypothetical protein